MRQEQGPINQEGIGNRQSNPNRARFSFRNLFGRPPTLAPAGIPVEQDTLQPKQKTQGPKEQHLMQLKVGDRPAVTDKPREAQPDLTPEQLEELKKKYRKDQRKGNPVGTAVKVGVALGILSGGAYAVYEGYQHVQAQERPANPSNTNVDAVNNFLNNGEIDNTFQAASPEIAKKFPIVLPKESFTPVTQEEKQSLWENIETVDKENHTFTISLPFSQKTIDASSEIRMNSFLGTDSFIGVPTKEIDKLIASGVKDTRQFSGILEKDAPIYSPYDFTKFDVSLISLSIAGVENKGFNPAYTSFRVILRDKQTGRESVSIIYGLYAKPLIEIKTMPTDHHAVFEDGTQINSTTQIMQLTTDLLDWDGKTGQIIKGEAGQVGIRSPSTNERVDPRTVDVFELASTLNLLKTPNGNFATGQ